MENEPGSLPGKWPLAMHTQPRSIRTHSLCLCKQHLLQCYYATRRAVPRHPLASESSRA